MAVAEYESAPRSTAAVETQSPAAMALTHDIHGIRIGAWSAEICGCFTDLVPNCWMATFLPFVSMAQIAHRIHMARYSVALLAFFTLHVLGVVLTAISASAAINSAEDSASTMTSVGVGVFAVNGSSAGGAAGSVATAMLSVVTLVHVLVIWQLRTQVRTRFQIPGGCLSDYCCVWWCPCCTIAQMATHVKSYTPGACDFGPPDMLPAYK